MTPLRPEVVHVPYSTDPQSQHGRIIEAVRQRKKMSYDKMSDRHDAWAMAEEMHMAYVKPTENDKKREQLRKSGKPQFTTIEVPYSYAMLTAAHTYWTSVFLGRNPILQFQGMRGDSVMDERYVETVMDYQVQVGGWLVPLYIWLMDMGKYGLGVVGSYWAEDFVVNTVAEEVDVTYFGIPTGRRRVQKTIRKVPSYKGNRIYNIRPQDWFPDPRVSLANFQKGEFCGRRITDVGWHVVLRRAEDGMYYNVEEVKKRLDKRWTDYYNQGSTHLTLPDPMNSYYLPYKTDDERGAKEFVELFEMVIELVPAQWKLGKSTYPEKWVFTIANEEVVVSVRPLGELHGQFPYDAIEYEIEGYALAKRSMYDILQPLNDTFSWLVNTHMHNVRKAINDQLVVDPSRVVMKDLEDPNAGRLIRLKPAAYGQDPRTIVSQLQTVDVTKGHIQDAQMVADWMQRACGVFDNIMGAVNQGGRKTATEVRQSSTMGINRLKTACEYASAMGFTPLAMKALTSTQQHYDEEQYYRITGRQGLSPEKRLITAEDIAGQYLYVPVDGTLPTDRFAQAMMWKEMLGMFAKVPQLAQGIDMLGIVGFIAQLQGMKNFENFKIKVVPDQMAMNNVQAGNVIPLSEANRGGTGTNPDGTAAGLPQAGAVSGVGRAG